MFLSWYYTRVRIHAAAACCCCLAFYFVLFFVCFFLFSSLFCKKLSHTSWFQEDTEHSAMKRIGWVEQTKTHNLLQTMIEFWRKEKKLRGGICSMFCGEEIFHHRIQFVPSVISFHRLHSWAISISIELLHDFIVELHLSNYSFTYFTFENQWFALLCSIRWSNVSHLEWTEKYLSIESAMNGVSVNPIENKYLSMQSPFDWPSESHSQIKLCRYFLIITERRQNVHIRHHLMHCSSTANLTLSLR